MNFPDSILVGNQKITIADMPESQTDQFNGLYSGNRYLIEVNMALQSHFLVEVLLHEINHAIYYVYNVSDSDDEERIVSIMSAGLTQVMRDNPQIFEYMHKLLSKPPK